MSPEKKAVVTGGAGFIGSHLAEELLRLGYRVTILDDLSTGKLENIEELTGNVEFIRGSITDLTLLKRHFKGASLIFHHAAAVSVPQSIVDPQSAHEVNATGTLNVLLASRDNNVKKLIYASSTAVYGDTTTLPTREDMVPHPLSPYAVAKLSGEHYCQIFREIYRLPTVCLRYFNVYGPRQDPNSQYAAVIPSFIKSILEGNPPVIFGDGEQTRDFAFVKDVVAANILAAESDAAGVFNISRGESTTINRLAEAIMELVGNNVVPVYQEPRPGEIRHSLADISQARSFGYKPKYDLKTGLSETIKWFHDR